MHIQIIDNVKYKAIETLASAFEAANDIRIAVAFISKDGLDMALPSIEKALHGGAKVEFLIGLDAQATDPVAVSHLYKQFHKTNRANLLCFVPPNASAIYHPKMYLAKTKTNATILIGSSNLTRRGLKTNVEANLVVRDDIEADIISEAYTAYNRLKYHPARVIPDDELIDLFGDLCRQAKRDEGIPSKGHSFQKSIRQFTDKAKKLQRPKPTKSDLTGWARNVYDLLPQREFKNHEIYKREEELRKLYPQNQNIRAKIRQQLQILRELGLVTHVGKGIWKKLD